MDKKLIFNLIEVTLRKRTRISKKLFFFNESEKAQILSNGFDLMEIIFLVKQVKWVTRNEFCSSS